MRLKMAWLMLERCGLEVAIEFEMIRGLCRDQASRSAIFLAQRSTIGLVSHWTLPHSILHDILQIIPDSLERSDIALRDSQLVDLDLTAFTQRRRVKENHHASQHKV